MMSKVDVIIINNAKSIGSQIKDLVANLGYSVHAIDPDKDTSVLEGPEEQLNLVLMKSFLILTLGEYPGNQNSFDKPIIHVTTTSKPAFNHCSSLSSLRYLDNPLEGEQLYSILQGKHRQSTCQTEDTNDSGKKYWLTACAGCLDVCDDDGVWFSAGPQIMNDPKVCVSHSICPSCVKKHYPEYYEDLCLGSHSVTNK